MSTRHNGSGVFCPVSTENGKVLRGDLPQPGRNRDHTHYGALDSEVIARLVFTLEDVLETNVSISSDDRFTDLGGTSLTAMKYSALLREQGIKVSSAQILQLNEPSPGETCHENTPFIPALPGGHHPAGRSVPVCPGGS